MAKYAMLIDERYCVTCGACVIACKEENNVPDGYHRDWVVERHTGVYPNLITELRSERCNHCEEPYCVYVCPTGASYVKDGIVLIDHNKCAGCGACIMACPYGARYMHPAGYVDKCTFCAHKIQNGKYTSMPACVAVCPTFALTFGDLEDPNSDINRKLKEVKADGRKLKVLKPEKGTKPKYYIVESDITRKKV
jgi:Fe-S-cluster-containing dehydrogenase component